VRGKKFMAAYDANAVLSIDAGTSGRAAQVDENAPDGGGDGGPIGNCGADRQSCPVCDLCSGPVPAGDPADVTCLDSCGMDGYGGLYGRVRARIVDPENITCVNGGQPSTFVVRSPDSANTTMNVNFYRFPVRYQGYCRGSN